MATAANRSVRTVRAEPEPVDLTHFTDQVAEALSAFSHDVTYAVLMARAAVSLQKKRVSSRARAAEPAA